MTEPLAPPPLPEWVYKRDGRLVPFDADRISRALFTATERLGRPDAFAARELTDGVVHFLRAEAEGTILTTAQVTELVVKVVRELGQPELAQAFSTRPKVKPALPAAQFALAELAAAAHSLELVRQAGRAGVVAYSLREVFAPDLAAAHAEGLLTLGGLEAPLELAGWLLGPPHRRLIEGLEQARRLAGEFVALDGPEYLWDRNAAEEFVRELRVGLRATGLNAVVNLNSTVPPHWAGHLAEGPLFAGAKPDAEAAGQLAADLSELLIADRAEARLRVDWHLGERDFVERRGRLAAVIRAALEGAAVAFAFDRPRRAVPLADGLDRQHPAVLQVVHLHLGRLLQNREGEAPAEPFSPARQEPRPPELLLRKLGSLARMALSAGVQKRAFLRRLTRDWPAFLLDRARLVVVPVGVEQVAEPLEVIPHLADVLKHDGQACHLDACLDANGSPQELAAGKSLKEQCQAAVGRGTATLIVAPDHLPAVEEVAELLQWVWKRTDLARVRFARAAVRQLVAPWEDSSG